MTNGKKAEAKVAYVPLPNFWIEILQPVTKAGPIHDHLQKFGIGIHHLGVGADANVDALRAELESKDGKWTGGVKGGNWAFVDFRHTPLGTTIELGPTARPAMPAAPTEQTGLFGGQRISHVGWGNPDAKASLDKLVQVFGLDYAPLRRFPDKGWFPYPPNMWTKEGWVETTMVPSANKIGMEIIQGFGGPNPWSAFAAKQKGPALMHIAVGRGKIPREEWLRIGQEKGGKWTNGGPPPEGSFAYLDWTETLGIVIE
jgi:hypothetical protein